MLTDAKTVAFVLGGALLALHVADGQAVAFKAFGPLSSDADKRDAKIKLAITALVGGMVGLYVGAQLS